MPNLIISSIQILLKLITSLQIQNAVQRQFLLQFKVVFVSKKSALTKLTRHCYFMARTKKFTLHGILGGYTYGNPKGWLVLVWFSELEEGNSTYKHIQQYVC